MAKKHKNEPAQMHEQAKGLIDQAFQLIRDQFQRIADDLADLERKRKEAQEELRRGPRQTKGRVI